MQKQSLTVFTGWHPEAWDQYAKYMVATFDKYWPENVKLVAYVENHDQATIAKDGRIEIRDLWSIPGIAEFIKEHSKIPEHCGRAPNERWKQKEIDNGYSYRFDAVKFCRQPFIFGEMSTTCDTSKYCWLDADVMTHTPVPPGFIESLIGENATVFLGRGEKHSEIGFVGFGNSQSHEINAKYVDYFRSGEVFDLPEWHSAYVYDCARKATGIMGKDLTPSGHGNVWEQSPLQQYMHHLKGKRKSKAAQYS